MFPICAVGGKSSLPSSSSFFVSCALSCFFPLSLGFIGTKSLVTHTAVFLWVSQAYFDTLIMPALSVSLCPLSLTLSPGFLLPQTLGMFYIPVKAASLSEGPEVKGSNQDHRPISVHRWLNPPLIRGLLSRQRSDSGILDKVLCSHLPTFTDLCSLPCTC